MTIFFPAKSIKLLLPLIAIKLPQALICSLSDLKMSPHCPGRGILLPPAPGDLRPPLEVVLPPQSIYILQTCRGVRKTIRHRSYLPAKSPLEQYDHHSQMAHLLL